MLMISDYLPSSAHVEIYLSGLTTLGIIAHAVNTFPTPANPYGQWFLGVIKFAVGQRISAMNAFQGKNTMVVAVPQGTGPGLTSSSQQASSKVDMTPDGLKVTDRKTAETVTILPNTAPPKEGE